MYAIAYIAVYAVILFDDVSGYRRHPRSVVAYSAEVAHHAVPIL